MIIKEWKKEIAKRVQLVKSKLPDAEIESLDYGLTWLFRHQDKVWVIAEVYRPERDKYFGDKMIDIGFLETWLDELQSSS